MTQKVKATRDRQKRKNRGVKPYRPTPQTVINIAMTTEAQALPILKHDISEAVKREYKIKSNKNRHCNIYVPEVNELEQPTGKLIRLQCDLKQTHALISAGDEK